MMTFMKKIILIAAASLMLLSSCTKGFEELGRNPNAMDRPTPELLLNSSVRGAMNFYGGDFNRVAMFNYTQMFVAFQGRFQRYSEDPQVLVNYWRDAYLRALMPAQNIIDIYADDPAYSNRVLMARIWKCYLLSQMTAIWGPIPYETGLAGDITTPYNREQDIYYMLFDDLKNAADALDMDGDVFGTDMLLPSAAGTSDILKWKKFAYSLRLRLAMRISNPSPNGDPVKAKEVVEDVFANEEFTMSSDDDCVTGRWGGLISAEGGDYNPLYYYAVYEKQKNIGTLPAFGETGVYHMKPYNDPRLPVYAQPVVSVKESDGTVPAHAGEYFGDTASYGGYGGESGIVLTGDNVHSALTREDYSPIGERFLASDAEFVFMSYAECCFLKAEARLKGWGASSSKSAEDYYYEGIRASMAHYSDVITEDAVAAYLETPGIKWGTATKTTDENGVDRSAEFKDWLGLCSSIVGTNDFQRQIIMQHWLAIPNQGLDMWTLLRRTQVLSFEPCFSGYEGFYKYLPYRLKYPTSETQYNTAECEKAYTEYLEPRGSFSGNDMYVKLWWALPNNAIAAIPNPTPYL